MNRVASRKPVKSRSKSLLASPGKKVGVAAGTAETAKAVKKTAAKPKAIAKPMVSEAPRRSRKIDIEASSEIASTQQLARSPLPALSSTTAASSTDTPAASMTPLFLQPFFELQRQFAENLMSAPWVIKPWSFGPKT